MHLTKNEEQILNGEQGEAKQKALKILVKLGDQQKADNLIPIRSAHIPNISYTEISESETATLEKWAEHFPKVEVLTTLNAGGVSRTTPDFVDDLPKQGRIINAFKAFHAIPALTTAPYTTENIPKQGQDLAWGHRSAVVYANSVLGACTNNHNWQTALSSALLGFTPNCGLHLQENREPTLTLKISDKMFGYEDFSALGYYASQEHPHKIINFSFSSKPNKENLQALASGFSVNTKKVMFTIGAPAPRRPGAPEPIEKIEVTFDQIDTIFQKFDSEKEPDFLVLGCPHFSSSEFQKSSRILKGKKLVKSAKFWVYTSEKTRAKLELDGPEEAVKKAGGLVATDACASLAPLKKFGVKCVMTNSTELCESVKTQGLEAKLSSFEDMLKWGFR
jgi:hypothetical protein|tara:strand:+ start:847 stop:2022 length:1176 start_codon:yes stop_codon:yes gene_type:complete